jgi:hypothetical protein
MIDPSGHRRLQGCRVDGVELVAAVSTGTHQPDLFEHCQMLGDRLASELDVVLGSEPAADLEQRLVVAFRQHVEDRSSCGRCQRVEHVGHNAKLRKSALAGKWLLAYGRTSTVTDVSIGDRHREDLAVSCAVPGARTSRGCGSDHVAFVTGRPYRPAG